MLSTEFKHGPLSAVTEGFPVLFSVDPLDVPVIVSGINEVTCRGGVVSIGNTCAQQTEATTTSPSTAILGSVVCPPQATEVYLSRVEFCPERKNHADGDIYVKAS